jgi:hypothetical protein
MHSCINKVIIVLFVFFSTSASADFQRWSAEKEPDPFTKGEKVVVDFMSSIRSGVFIMCDTTQPGLQIRAIPGFTFDSSLEGMNPEMKIAIDGELLLTKIGQTGMLGDNLAAATMWLDDFDAKRFIEAFAASKKQIAIQDGIADKPHLMKASGSTKSAQALQSCLEK